MNHLSVHVIGSATDSGTLTLDFRFSDDFVAGSLRVLQGAVAALGGRRVVLRLAAPARVEYRRR